MSDPRRQTSAESNEPAKLEYESSLHARLAPSEPLTSEEDESLGCAVYILIIATTFVGALFAYVLRVAAWKVAVAIACAGAGSILYIAVRHRRWMLMRGMLIGVFMSVAFAVLLMLLLMMIAWGFE
jgi:hypothetical protein